SEERAAQRRAVRRAERLDELDLEGVDERAEAIELRAAERRQLERVPPPIRLVTPPREQASGFHASHEVGDRRAVEPELLAELPLARAGQRRDDLERGVLDARDRRR